MTSPTTFTIYNYSSSTATINSLEFITPAGFSHTADLSAMGGYLTSETAYSESDTVPRTDVTYVSDTSPITTNYRRNTSTSVTRSLSGTATVTSSTLALSSTASISIGDMVSGSVNLDSETAIIAVGGSSVTISRNPVGTISSGTNLTFTRYILVVNSTNGIQPSWVISSNGYLSNQHVTTIVSATWVTSTAGPTSAPSSGLPINFTTSSIELVVNNTAGISAGDRATRNGYTSNQTVVSVTDSTRLQMSAYPSSTPSVGLTIRFYHDQAIIGLAPNGGSVPFIQDYSNVSSGLGTYQASININAVINSPVVKVINNTLFVTAAPVVTATYDPGSGGYSASYDGGGGGDGSSSGNGCSSSSASASCSADSGSPGGADSGGGSVICTALHKLGYMEKEIFEYDQAYGLWLYQNDFMAYYGYRAWADVIIKYVNGHGQPMLTKLLFWKTPDAQHQLSQQIAILLARIMGGAFSKELARRAGYNIPFSFSRWLCITSGLAVTKTFGYIVKKIKRTNIGDISFAKLITKTK